MGRKKLAAHQKKKRKKKPIKRCQNCGEVIIGGHHGFCPSESEIAERAREVRETWGKQESVERVIDADRARATNERETK